jgi:DNA-binding winged helix-turn-helix (wHTH) protein
VLLRYLVEHAQRLVTQEELLKALWQPMSQGKRSAGEEPAIAA